VDSTPDISNIDQLTIVLRYVDKHGSPIERFVTFLPLKNHTGSGIFQTFADFLSKFDISLMNCRGQTYDNARNMSGKYRGVQARLG
jgi:hypothetical protein